MLLSDQYLTSVSSFRTVQGPVLRSLLQPFCLLFAGNSLHIVRLSHHCHKVTQSPRKSRHLICIV